MKRFTTERLSWPSGRIPFWMPWGLGRWAGKSLLFHLLLLCFLALFCFPGRLLWLFWLLFSLLSILYLLSMLPKHGEPVPHTGDVQILLEWGTEDDLDLHVFDPAGEMIYFGHRRSASGGELDVDANASLMNNMMKHPKENVYWRRGEAPAGQYKVFVHLYCLRGSLPVSFNVMAKYGRDVEHFEGVIETDGSTVHVCTFSLLES